MKYSLTDHLWLSIIKRFDRIIMSHKDMALAFISLRTVVMSATALSNKLASNALLK